MIDRLPPEVLMKIVSFAYTDGGGAKLIHQLCLVSKYFKAIADPFKFRFVAVVGLKQLSSLLRVIRRNPLRAKQISSLFLSESPPWPPPPEPRGLRKWLFRRFLLLPRGPDFVQVASRLMSKIRPTLQALTCVVDHWFPEEYGTVLSQPFPALTRLNIRAAWFRYPRDAKFHHGTFPALTYLHVSSEHYLYSHNLSHVASLCQQCPKLETLKLSGAWPDPDHFQHMWLQFYTVEPRPHNVVPVTPSLRRTVRRVIIQNYYTDSDALGVMSEIGAVPHRTPVSRADVQEGGVLWLKPVNPPKHSERVHCAFEELHRGSLTGMGTIESFSVQRVYPLCAFEYLHVPITLTIGIYT
jgi:hypothetical protein